jgi:hypothetical protein
MMMERLFNAFLYFKKGNFTVTREFKFGNVVVKEYTYNMSRYYTDTWPPNILAGTGFPIFKVVREDDGVDVTNQVLKFSGPRKNYVNPLSTCTYTNKVSIQCVNFGIRIRIEKIWIPYTGNVIVTDILGRKRTLQINLTNFGDVSSSKIYKDTVCVPGGS